MKTFASIAILTVLVQAGIVLADTEQPAASPIDHCARMQTTDCSRTCAENSAAVQELLIKNSDRQERAERFSEIYRWMEDLDFEG